MGNPLKYITTEDKQLHFAFTFILTNIMFIICCMDIKATTSWVVVLVILKELLDLYNGGKFDYKDIMWGLFGFIAFFIINFQYILMILLK